MKSIPRNGAAIADRAFPFRAREVNLAVALCQRYLGGYASLTGTTGAVIATWLNDRGRATLRGEEIVPSVHFTGQISPRPAALGYEASNS